MKSPLVAAILFVTACASGGGEKLHAFEARDQLITQQIATFDDLDFNVFSNQKWDELKKSHAPDIVVHWPDGHTTKGIDVHIADLKAMFVFAPNTRIKEHPVKFGNGEWTAVYGTMEATFSQPMPLGDGKFLPPTGKSVKLPMTTLGHWNKDGVMSEEYLFWDNATYMKGLGIGN